MWLPFLRYAKSNDTEPVLIYIECTIAQDSYVGAAERLRRFPTKHREHRISFLVHTISPSPLRTDL